MGAAVIVCADGKFPATSAENWGRNSLPYVAACLRKPATGSFAAEMDGRSARPFSLCERETEKRNEVNERWQFTIWKQKWSAGAQAAPPWPLPLKKLAALVARTVPAIAEGLEKLRSRVLIYCYQLSHICSGKSHIQKSLAVWKPELERYTGLVQQIKAKSKERKTLVAEKKELPIYHVKRHKALAVRIAELTEDLEELRFEKALLLQKFEYAEDAGAEAFRKDIATMEACLKKLETREQKYSVELDKALTEYAELKAQAADFDPVELYKARQVIRPAQEKAAEQQLEDAMHEKPSLIMLLSAKQETSHLLGADAEERQARQLIMHRNQEQYRNSLSKRKRNDPER